MSEFEGEVIRLWNPEQKVNALRQLNSRLEVENRDLRVELEAAKERIKKLLGEHILEGKAKSKKPRGKGPQVRKNFKPPAS